MTEIKYGDLEDLLRDASRGGRRAGRPYENPAYMALDAMLDRLGSMSEKFDVTPALPGLPVTYHLYHNGEQRGVYKSYAEGSKAVERLAAHDSDHGGEYDIKLYRSDLRLVLTVDAEGIWDLPGTPENTREPHK